MAEQGQDSALSHTRVSVGTEAQQLWGHTAKPCRASRAQGAAVAELGQAWCQGQPWPEVIPAPFLHGQSSRKIDGSENFWLGWFFSPVIT